MALIIGAFIAKDPKADPKSGSFLELRTFELTDETVDKEQHWR
jgi:hypothetical protein